MSKVAKATIGLMIATVIAKMLGFVRELVLASSYGATKYSDAYLTAVDIPTAIFSIIGGALGAVLIPMYFEVRSSKGEKSALKFMNNVLGIVTIICIILAILGIAFAENLINVFAMGFGGERLSLAIKFTRFTMITIIFTGMGYILSAYMQIKNNFVIPGIISVPKNIIIIISIILSLKYEPTVMIIGTIIGIASEPLFQLPFAMKEGYRIRPTFNINDEYIKKIFILIGPVLVGVAAGQVNLLIDRTLASTLVEGSISALNYANKLNGFIMAMFISSIGTVIYPSLAKLSQNNDKESFSKVVVRCVNSVILLLMPISVGAIVLAKPIVKLLFERGQFDETATIMTSVALVMYSVGMVGLGLRDILGKVFYALQDTKTPMKNGIIAIIINIILNFVLIKYLKLGGLALATSISAIVCIILYIIELRKKIGDFGLGKVIGTTLKSFVAAVVMGIGTNLTYNFMIGYLGNGFFDLLVSLFISVIFGILIYGALIVLFKVEEIAIVKDMLDKILKKNI